MQVLPSHSLSLHLPLSGGGKVASVLSAGPAYQWGRRTALPVVGLVLSWGDPSVPSLLAVSCVAGTDAPAILKSGGLVNSVTASRYQAQKRSVQSPS
ncbi:hypothetical protein NDU88_001044 [Pleurodeles waltl]|uniref:Uncharacterized protein n=1 Tax=Pleurodeles waltl TaxID=8319 RepID=A0AAV7LYK7_PLEWA|nr:hypothetical protein NDU88_001044 [Pleurodeles waltl]